jgi:hypothetical protein
MIYTTWAQGSLPHLTANSCSQEASPEISAVLSYLLSIKHPVQIKRLEKSHELQNLDSELSFSPERKYI